MLLKKYLLGLSFLVLAIFAYYAQTLFFLEGDVFYLIQASDKLLHGGSYTNNFFETNPPMILYLYLPVVLSMLLFKFKLVTTVRIYVLSLALLSLFLSNDLLKRCAKYSQVRFYLLAAISFCFFFLPCLQLAQREHFLFILTMPYWLLIALRAEKIKPPFFLALIIGSLAGPGFALKPFFLAPLILVEVYLSFKERSWFSFFRTETFTVFFILLSYAISIFIFQPDYIKVILPLVSHYYFIGAAEPWGTLLVRPPTLFCLTIAMLAPIFCRLIHARHLAVIFSLALVGLILAFIIPRTPWFYHVLPALGMAILLVTLVIAEAPNLALKIVFGLIFFALPLHFSYLLYSSQFLISNELSLNEFIQFIDHEFPDKNIYCIPAHRTCSILSAYSNSHYVSRFPSFWALRGIFKKTASPQRDHDENFLLDLLAEDLERKKPELVIFDNAADFENFNTAKAYITYLSKNTAFQHAWKAYSYLKTIGPYEIYRLQLL